MTMTGNFAAPVDCRQGYSARITHTYQITHVTVVRGTGSVSYGRCVGVNRALITSTWLSPVVCPGCWFSLVCGGQSVPLAAGVI